MKVERILITGDFFRCDESRVPHQLPNAERIYNMIGRNLLETTDLQPTIWFVHDGVDPETKPADMRLPVEYFETLGVEPSFASWAKCYFSEASDELVDMFAEEFRSSLIVTCEMSPLIQSILDRLGVPWIDMFVSPIRFLQDFSMSFRFSKHFSLSGLERFFVSQDDIDLCVERIRGFFGRDRRIYDDSVLFFAQTEFDRTLIFNGAFYQDDDVIENLEKVVGGRRLFIKPHPHALDNPLLQRIIDKFGAEYCMENTYAMLASSSIFECATISSSVSLEARHFGRRTHVFNPRILEYIYSGPISMHGYEDSRFWQALLGQVMDTRPPVSVPPKPAPNQLRELLGYYSMERGIW